MKIAYIANARIPTEKAHGLHIMKAAEAFSLSGNEVELIIPDRRTPITTDSFAYYQVAHPFPIRRLPVLDTVRFGKLGFLLESLSFAFVATRYVRSAKPDVVYSRDEIVLYIASLVGIRNIIWESHDGAWNFFARHVARRARGIVTVSAGAKETYVTHGISPSKILAVPNGIELRDFAKPESKEAARKRLGLPGDARIVLYIGRLDGWKGTDTLLAAAPHLPPEVKVAVIGGEEAQVQKLQERHPGVIFLGHRPYGELADNQAAADVLIIPNTGKSDVSVRFTSPLKLLSYMASGVPIVASDLPSIREIAGEDATYVTPDDPEALVHGIEAVLSDTYRAKALADAAREHVVTFAWSTRAKRILDFVTDVRKVRLLALYRGSVLESRGTPIRVFNLLSRLATDPRFSLAVASWDEALPFEASLLHLSNRKRDDLAQLFKTIREKDIDVVMGHTMATWYYLAAVKVFMGKALALEMHGFVEEEALLYGDIGFFRYWFEKSVYALFYRMCDLITTCSETAAEVLRAYNREVYGIFGGVDTEVFNPGVSPMSLGFDTGDIVIGYAGNSRLWQGLPFLVGAFEELRKRDARFKLALLVSETKGIPEGEDIRHFPRVVHEEVPRFLAACDMLVIPRPAIEVNRLAFPSKLLEYMAMGKPVIASATSDADRVITQDVDGLIYPPGDTEALIRNLMRLADPTLRKRLGDAAAKTAKGRFEWGMQAGILAGRLQALYRSHV